MSNRVHRVVVLLWIAFVPVMSFAAPPTRPSLAHELLQRPAPAQNWRVHLGLLTEDQVNDPVAEAMAQSKLPGPDATDEQVAYFWVARMDWQDPPVPTPIPRDQQSRLLAAGLKDPDLLRTTVTLLEASRETADRLQKLVDAHPNPPLKPGEEDGSWQVQVRHWLLHNSDLHRDDLLLLVDELRTVDTDANREAFRSLARADLAMARKMGDELFKSEGLIVPAFARSVMLRRELAPGGDKALAAVHRDALLKIVDDPETVSAAHDLAVQTLAAVPWPDDRAAQDRWVLKVMNDEPIYEIAWGDRFAIHPLVRGMDENPQRWIAMMSTRIGHAERKQHLMAVKTVAALLPEEPDPKLLTPLLPWLKDRDWGAGDRRKVIIQIASLDMPESAEGLLAVVRAADGVEHSEATFAAAFAAEALGRYNPKGSVEALERAMKGQTIHELPSFHAALVACGGIADIKAIAALESYARWNAKRNAMPVTEVNRAFPNADFPDADLGRSLADVGFGAWRSRRPAIGMGPTVAQALVARADALRAKEPRVAEEIREILDDWTTPIACSATLRWALAADATPDDVDRAATAAKAIRATAADELVRAVTGNRRAAGIAAAILAKSDTCKTILESNDTDAATYLLATARLARTPIEVPLIARRLLKTPSDNKEVALGELTRAAEMYLVAFDTAESRAIVHARHPDKALVLGPNHQQFAGEAELFDPENYKDIRDEIQRDNAVVREIIVLYSSGGFGDDGQREVRVLANGSATLTTSIGPGNEKRERPLTAAELAELRNVLAQYKADELPPLEQMVFDGVWYHYVHLTRAGGRQVYINNPDVAAGTPYDALVRHFQKLKVIE